MREYQQAVNPKTGRLETVFADLRLVYPDFDNPMAIEYSFEELRARHRGWLDQDWASVKKTQVVNANKQSERPSTALSPSSTKISPPVESHEKAHKPQTVPLKGLEDDLGENDENAPPSQADLEKAKAARKARREERANRTRNIKVMEVREIRAETQTSTPFSDFEIPTLLM
jgi:checkpoint serine/threonine-protein kinase